MKIEISIDEEKLQEEECQLCDFDTDSRNLEYFIKAFLSDFEERYPQYKEYTFNINPDTEDIFSEIFKSYMDLTNYLKSLELKRIKNRDAKQQS